MRSPARPLAQPKSIIANEAQVLVLPQPLMGPAGNFVHVDMPEAGDIWPFSLQSALFLHARYFPQDLVFPETVPPTATEWRECRGCSPGGGWASRP